MKNFIAQNKIPLLFLSGFISAVIIISLVLFISKELNVTDTTSTTASNTITVTETSTANPTTITSTSITNSTTRTTTRIISKILPLGDGKYTSAGAKKGYIYVCNANFNGSGAFKDGSWITGTTWDSTKKIAVQGDVKWPTANITITVNGTNRVITTNDLPTTHNTGVFPISASDPAYQFDHNPNKIAAQNKTFTLPANPTLAATPQCIFGMVGVMLDGVILFDGLDAGGRDAAAHEVQDKCSGHPEKTSAYHYHSLSDCITDGKTNKLIGYAFDGFGIYGYLDNNGTQIISDDLDECHGTTSLVNWDGKQVNMYHYVMTQDYPYSIGCFKGASKEPRPM